MVSILVSTVLLIFIDGVLSLWQSLAPQVANDSHNNSGSYCSSSSSSRKYTYLLFMIMLLVILWCLDVVLSLPHVPLCLQKGDESETIDGLHRQHGEHESKDMWSVSTGVKLLVDYSSNAKGRDSAKSCLGKEESNGSKGGKESTGTFDHVLDGAVGAVVLSEGTVFLVGNEWSFDLLFTVGSDGLVEEGVGSHVSLEAILVSHGGKVDEHDGLSKNNEAEVEPLEVQGLD